MLIEFSATNYRSIRSRQTLNLTAGSASEHAKRNVVGGDKSGPGILRSAVIYGPNAAGKSNLVRAVATLQQLVMGSATQIQEGQPLPVAPFMLSKESAEQPSEFEIVFVVEGIRYHYACAVTPTRVTKEWLVAYPRGHAQRWFEREYDAQKEEYSWWFGPNFRGERKVWKDLTRANALFLSTAIQLNNAQLRPVFIWFTDRLIVLQPGVSFNPFLSLQLLGEQEGYRIMRYMRAADIGIDRLEVREEEFRQQTPQPLAPGALRINFEVGAVPGAPPSTPKKLQILFWHSRIDSPDPVAFNLSDESDGTQKLFEFTGGWIRALDRGATLVIDELDRSLHPHVTRFLVELFHGKDNEHNAQLVFTTHDTTLIDTQLMRRDQIWFVEKDKEQSTHLYSLFEFQPRKDEALQRGYLRGRYGAIPFIGTLAER